MKFTLWPFFGILTCCALAVVAGAAEMGPIDRGTLDDAFRQAAQYQWGGKRGPLDRIDRAVVASAGDAAAREEIEARLISLLQGQATVPAKDFACRQLASIGGPRTVAAVAPLLTDPELSHRARYTLQRIPDASAAQALRDALPRVQGDLKAGVLNSLAGRRDAASLPLIEPLAGDADPQVARAATAALGQVGGQSAIDAIAARLAISTGPARCEHSGRSAGWRRKRRFGRAASIWRRKLTG